MTLEEYVDRVASTSFVGAMTSERRGEFLNEVRDALSGFAEPLELRYLTDVTLRRRIPRTEDKARQEGSTPFEGLSDEFAICRKS